MLEKEKEVDPELQELIQIVNYKARELKTIQQNGVQGSAVPISEKKISEKNQFSKVLRFKPWSGKASLQSQEMIKIKEEIEGVEERDDEQSCSQNEKVNESFSDVSNMAKYDEIGYFYKFQNSPVRLIKKLLDQNGFKYTNNNKNWTIYWSSTIIKNQTYQTLHPYQKINHFPNSFHLTRKDLMNKYVSRMQIRHGISHFNFLPKTFILPQQLDLLKDEMNKTPGITYIVKPHNRSQGKGITVTNQLTTVYTKLQKYSSLIVSHYIDNPLLINGLKFDLRIYVALTGVNPLRIYIYQEGLGRFATQIYDETATDCQNKKFQHLTNYSVNKKNLEFIKSENQNQDYFGSKWSLTALKDFLSFNIGKDETCQLFDRIDDLIVKTILSGQNVLHTAFMSNVPYNNSCFQVLGFDVLIDSNLKPWLMEVNMSPSMNSDSPLDIKIKGNMISDLFTLVGITPLTERYLDGNHLRYDIKNFIKSDNKQIVLGPVERFVLKEVEAQNSRKGAWRRAYPTSDKRYKQFFEVDRYFNRLLRDYDQKLQTSEQAPYRSTPNEREKSSLSKRVINTTGNGYNSANEKRKVSSRQKVPHLSIKLQGKNVPGKRVYL